MKNIFKKLFHKESELEKESKLTEEIINNNLSEIETKVRIIKYTVNENTEEPIVNIISDFHNQIMPSIDSIIWAPNKEKTKMVPFKVIRFDFFEDPDTDADSFIYIVVKDAELYEVTNINLL